MPKSLLRYIVTAIVSFWLIAPAPALAAINSSPAAAAADGLKYLTANQQADGSISGGVGGETEWTAVAVQAAGKQASTFTNGGTSLLAFLEGDAAGPSTSPTTLERKIIAIAAMRQNPSNFGGVDYETLLSAQHTGGQIGDPTLLNDDMFGIIAIDAAHDSSLLPEAQDALNYLLAHQGTDGGFSYTTSTCAYCGSDSSDTAAAIIALYAARDLGLGSPAVDAAASSALTYLLGTQQVDGGFGYDASSPSDGSSTAWSLMALNAVGSSAASAAASGRNWLLQDQNADGGFAYGAYGITTSDTYTTSSAVIALLGTTWLLNPAPIPITSGGSGGSTGSSGSPGGTKTTTTPAATTSSSQAPDQTVATETSASPPTQTTTSNNDKPHVKAASTTTPSHAKTTASTVAKPSKARSYNIYIAILLGVIAIMWFMLESRKTRRENT